MSVAGKLQIKPGHKVVVLRKPDGVELDIASSDVLEEWVRPVRQVSVDDTWSALRFRATG